MQYIKDSVNAKQFMPETDYQEIGEFTSVAKHWCRMYQETGQRAFQDWKVQLRVSPNKEHGFKRLLAAGNGILGPGGFTLVEKSKFRADDSDCIDSTFLIDYLLSLGKKSRSSYALI
jgi:uncharacterized protein YecA (UPF0149 family)